MNLQSRQTIVALALMGSFVTSPACAQRILDWPLRTTAGPQSVMRGVEASFWNPAALAVRSRGQALVADQRTPDAIGVTGFAAAGSWRLDARTVVGAGYQHVGIDDIGETSTSPLPDTDNPTFSISEDQLAFGASHALGVAVSAGAGVRYYRSNETGINESSTSLVAGFLINPTHMSWRPVLGANLQTETGGVRYSAGAEVGLPHLATDLDLHAGYGIRGGEDMVAVEHRAALTATWRDAFIVTAGVASAAPSNERSWEPVLGASVRVSRYELGVLRETLASQFGAAYSFRFRFDFE
jgi:hypothetical protein